jgi:hypothetical protein
VVGVASAVLGAKRDVPGPAGAPPIYPNKLVVLVVFCKIGDLIGVPGPPPPPPNKLPAAGV